MRGFYFACKCVVGLFMLAAIAVPAFSSPPAPAPEIKPLTDELAKEYKLDASFYKKCMLVQDILIATSDRVSDYAHLEAAYQFDMIMNSIKPHIARRIRDRKVLCILIAYNEMTSELPQFTTDKAGKELDFYNWRRRGFLSWEGGRPTVVFAEEDVLEYEGGGYEIAGFSWHQGWNDGCSADAVNQYEENITNFIRDVRREFGVKDLPFVIANSGFAGWPQKIPRRLGIMKAQAAAAEYEEFKGNVVCVETRDFYRPEEDSPTRFRYHWNHNAETFFLIGNGMGEAMVKLLDGVTRTFRIQAPYSFIFGQKGPIECLVRYLTPRFVETV